MANPATKGIIIVKVILAYVCVTNGRLSADYASRFVGSYLQCPPGVEHETVICCNGGPLPLETALLFDAIPHSFLPRVNDPSWDIGAFMEVATKMPCDMLVCLGESVYFHKPNWLRPMLAAWEQFGPGMYGFFASHLVRAHLNTTAFVVAPQYLVAYPKPTDKRSRYEMEHGVHSLWKHVNGKKRPVKLVTWDGTWNPGQWRLPENILWRGDQSNCLVFCSHSDHYRAASIETRKRWAQWADQPYR